MVMLPTAPCLPAITPEAVKTALESLLYAAMPNRDRSLQYLTVVEQALVRHHLSSHSLTRTIALHQFLTRLMVDQYRQHRQVLGLPAVDSGANLSMAENAIAADTRAVNHELIGWSWFYYRYVRTDLGLSLQRFSQLAHMDERTLRRHHRHTLERLTSLLTEAEAEATSRQRQQRLLRRLPDWPLPPLVGRQAALDWLHRHLQETTPRPVQVVGASGIGKSALVQTAVRRQIEAGWVDELVWIDQPDSIAAIWSVLEETLPLEYPRHSEVLSPRTVVVLDGMDKLLHEAEAVRSLLRKLAPALTFLTAQAPLPLFHEIAVVRLAALDAAETTTLLRRLSTASHPPIGLDADLMSALWEESRGNPAIILRTFAALQEAT
jgi:hypothetical protein